MTYSSDPFLKHFCFVHFFKSELGERSPAIICNSLESLQPVDQVEAGMADESAGGLLPFLCGENLSYFLLVFLKRFTVFCVLNAIYTFARKRN